MNESGKKGHLQETVNFKSGVQLYKDTRLNMHDHVSLVGTVTHVPAINPFNIQVGDKAFFRYDVVFEGDFVNNTRTYENLLIMPDGSEEWVLHPYAIIGYERDGKLTLVNNLVMAKTTTRETDWKSDLIFKNTSEVEIDGKKFFGDYSVSQSEDVVEVLQNDTALPIKKGDKCYALRSYIQHYNFNSTHGEDVLIIPSQYLIARL